ncbi:uncharacterized protein LOC127834714 [Dreissena polymorpha]|nr:uncharacterized protein LOC127834714 [Dreissena polymorpha]
MENVRNQNKNRGSDGPENESIQDVKFTRHDTTQKEMEQEKLNIREENTDLICEIADLCKRPDRTGPEVILLLGSVGVGKSAIVNTIIKAMTGKHYHKAKTGRGNTASKTLAFEWFGNCGIEKYELQGLQKEAFSDCLNMLPNIFDVPGMGDHYLRENIELLEAVIEGYIPPGTSVKSLQKLQKDYGVGCLKKIYPNSSKEWAVTRVVFVASADQSLPTALADIVRRLLDPHDQATGHFKSNIDLFVVITKCDLVEGFNTSGTTGANMIKQDTFKKMENEVADVFSIGGAMEQNSIRWQSYVDGRCLDDTYIDNIALKFVRQMMLPRRKRHQVETDKSALLTPQQRFLLKLTYVVNGMDPCQKFALVAVIMLSLFVYFVIA